jgi:hypothetical protein
MNCAADKALTAMPAAVGLQLLGYTKDSNATNSARCMHKRTQVEHEQLVALLCTLVTKLLTSKHSIHDAPAQHNAYNPPSCMHTRPVHELCT